MKNGYLWAALIVVIVAAIGVYVLIKAGSQPTSTPVAPSAEQSGTNAAPTTQTVQGGATGAATVSGAANATVNTATQAQAPAAAPAAKHFSVNGNDSTADLKTITVAKGTPVTITFGADASGTYHGGLDFRSSVVSTGTIAPGTTKTVSFTADHSFSFQPYWPATNIAKPYTIAVVVSG